MDTKKILEQLVKVASSQQKIIHKLAQQLPPMNLAPAVPHKDAKSAILAALGPAAQNVADLSVHDNTVEVSFHPGHATQANYNHLLKTVEKLQASKALPGASYHVKVV